MPRNELTEFSWVVLDKLRKVQGCRCALLVACLPDRHKALGGIPNTCHTRLFKVILTWILSFQLQEAMPFKTKIRKKEKEVLNSFSKCVCNFTFQPAAQ